MCVCMREKNTVSRPRGCQEDTLTISSAPENTKYMCVCIPAQPTIGYAEKDTEELDPNGYNRPRGLVFIIQSGKSKCVCMHACVRACQLNWGS